MFAIAHLDFTLILWPYYVAVSAIYGTGTFLTNSILPAVVLHTAGNIYSNFYLWLHRQATPNRFPSVRRSDRRTPGCSFSSGAPGHFGRAVWTDAFACVGCLFVL
jgi:membrane protease YdiL (CAAX protease family)